jgi:hypothetical protein
MSGVRRATPGMPSWAEGAFDQSEVVAGWVVQAARDELHGLIVPGWALAV